MDLDVEAQESVKKRFTLCCGRRYRLLRSGTRASHCFLSIATRKLGRDAATPRATDSRGEKQQSLD